jgi:hypothetical protein
VALHEGQSKQTQGVAAQVSIGLHRIWPAEDEDVYWPRDRLAFNDELLIALGDSVN